MMAPPNSNGDRISDSNIREALEKLRKAGCIEARQDVIEGFVLGAQASTQERLRDLYRRLPKRPWIINLISGVSLVVLVALGAWFGGFEARTRSDVNYACEQAKAATTRVEGIDARLRGLSEGVAVLLALQEQEAERRGKPLSVSPAQKRLAAQRVGITLPPSPPVDTIRD
jgi:hypothetical protein